MRNGRERGVAPCGKASMFRPRAGSVGEGGGRSVRPAQGHGDQWRRPTESFVELVRRMQDEPDGKKRRWLHALSLVASGQAQHRKAVAAALGVHRHSVAACFTASATGGVEQALQYDIPMPEVVKITV